MSRAWAPLLLGPVLGDFGAAGFGVLWTALTILFTVVSLVGYGSQVPLGYLGKQPSPTHVRIRFAPSHSTQGPWLLGRKEPSWVSANISLSRPAVASAP
jgi:hypothetical protein